MRCDFVVIGAGSAGTVLASRLSANDSVSVVLIEAGPDYPDLAHLPPELKFGYATAAYAETHGHLWDYHAYASAGQPATPLPRGKVVGGTSAVNGQVFLRALADDFRLWVQAGNDAWPFEHVLPVYKQLEADQDFADEWHGTGGPVAIRRYEPSEWLETSAGFYEACRAAGFPDCPDANRPDATGVGPIPFNNVGGLRLSSAVTHLAAARYRENLTVLAETFARRLLIDGGRVVGLEVESGTKSVIIEAGEYIVSAGAIGSPLLLMHSGIGPEETLRRAGIPVVLALEGVGQRLRDHQLADIVFATDPAVETPSPSAPRVQIGLRYTATGSSVADDMQITMRTSAPGSGDSSLVSLAPSLQFPEATGEVRPVSPNPHDLPRIELRFLSSDLDMTRIREGVELCLELSGEPALSPLLGSRLVPDDNESRSAATLSKWLRKAIRTSHHCSGSCAMGPESDSMSVVDQGGRVLGISNLRVVDASIFPEIVRANPNATVLMMSEQIAGGILESSPPRSQADSSVDTE